MKPSAICGYITQAPTRLTIITQTCPILFYTTFHESRASQCTLDFLQGHSGYLQVDGYQGYATLAGCWAHARRKFKEADIAQAKGKPKAGKATWAMSHIKELYRIEA